LNVEDNETDFRHKRNNKSTLSFKSISILLDFWKKFPLSRAFIFFFRL